ncbi:MAG: sulfotransferase [Okeania sp. SIO2G4]|uniref:sulfotransferase family protein n=1 Tax=unclassified Okeania TaxID=2634635 RepID=UPI0013B9230A|nr:MULTISPECIES: sulfotransferase [unclassified Okeania]NEP37874.1 sulfotransferase [Okeania sp. SIO2H7]NEP72609.1 sulfotransferase [Okeania sp. SIO2G5]NEP94365.1 sulfotransferase [Okeania sp. SIO2F5]NEQ92546.1 sulfotransferase [Okeania sp. SIO2G4]
MNDLIKEIRQSIRLIKNDMIHKYYDLRINQVEDPYRAMFRTEPYKFIFILSHMRSGSSLLANILSSHTEILGYGETHIQYASEFDLNKLVFKVHHKTQNIRRWQDLKKLRMNHKYILDKALHNKIFLDEKLLTSENLYSIFLIRDPERTIASILDLKPHWSEEKVLTYYLNRLSTLERYAKLINSKERTLIISYDQLLNQTDLVFDALKKVLGTQSEFSEEYKVTNKTGRPGIGDSKENIKAGRIVRNPRKLEQKITPTSIAEGIKKFENCTSTLSEYCSFVKNLN